MSLLSQGPSPRWRQEMTGTAGAGAGQRGRGITRPARSDSAGRAGIPSLSSSDLAAPATASVIGRHRSTRGWVLGRTRPPGRLRTCVRLQRRHRPHLHIRIQRFYAQADMQRQGARGTVPAQFHARRCGTHVPADRAAELPSVSSTPSPRRARRISATRRRQPARGPRAGTRRDRADDQLIGKADNFPSSMRPARFTPASVHRSAPST